jgi:hypothetical protein
VWCADSSFYEKPPTAVVAGKKTKIIDDDDHTPKSFLRLVKRKTRKELIAEGKVESKKDRQITIQPGESFNDFRRRVDKEIPVRLGSMGKEGKLKKKKPKPAPKNENDDEYDEEEEPKKKRYGPQERERELIVDGEGSRRRGVFRRIRGLI